MKSARKRHSSPRVPWSAARGFLAEIEDVDSWKDTEREGFLYWLCSRAGLLSDAADNSVEFAHQSFEEYLAANHAKEAFEGEARIEFARTRAADSTWWETLRLWAAQVSGNSPARWTPVMQELFKSDAGLGVAGAVLADGTAEPHLSRWLEAFLPQLVDGWTESFEYCARAFAASSNRPTGQLVEALNRHAPSATAIQWVG